MKPMEQNLLLKQGNVAQHIMAGLKAALISGRPNEHKRRKVLMKIQISKNMSKITALIDNKKYSFDALSISKIAVQTLDDENALNVAFELIKDIQSNDIRIKHNPAAKNDVFHRISKALLNSSIEEIETFLSCLSDEDGEIMVECLIKEYHKQIRGEKK